MGRLKYKEAQKRKTKAAQMQREVTVEDSFSSEETVPVELVEVKANTLTPSSTMPSESVEAPLETSEPDERYSEPQAMSEAVGPISEGSAEVEPVVVSTPHVTGWELVPSLYGSDNSTLVFSVDELPIVHLEVTPQSVMELLYVLNEQVGNPLVDPVEEAELQDKPDAWLIKTPEDRELSPILYFTSQGHVLTSVDLTPEVLTSLLPRLKAIHGDNSSEGGFWAWASNNRVKTGLGMFVVLAVIVYGALTTYL